MGEEVEKLKPLRLRQWIYLGTGDGIVIRLTRVPTDEERERVTAAVHAFSRALSAPVEERKGDMVSRDLKPASSALGWRTIDSVPKDVSRHLVYVPRNPTPDNSTTFDIYEAAYVGGYDSGDMWFSKGLTVYGPTHWMPLPAPPSGQQGSGANTSEDGQLRDTAKSALASSTPESSEQPVWRRNFLTLPEVGRKFIALYNDGSGAAMFWRHDDGFIDHDGDEYPAEKAWSSSFDAWAYLPDDLEFWCEAGGDEPMTFALPTPAEARSEQAGETWPCPVCGGHDDDRQLSCEACGGAGLLGDAQ